MFLKCRRDRIDLNVLYDLSPELLMNNVEEFIEQIPEVDLLNQFLSELK